LRIAVIRISDAVTMPAEPALQRANKAKTRRFHATMLVTRLEEWCVEAETSEEARLLLAGGVGERCTPGESIQVEIDSILDERY
jgi:hypothetical protein